MEKPATSLGRPLQRLLDLGLVHRELPFGATLHDSKRTVYVIADPFLRFWFRFVDPERSRLEGRRLDAVAGEIARGLAPYVGGVWEELARASVPHLNLHGRRWRPAARWWGAGVDRSPIKIDVVAESEDRSALLLGEAVWGRATHAESHAADLRRKALNFPLTGHRRLVLALWVKEPASRPHGVSVLGPEEVVRALSR